MAKDAKAMRLNRRIMFKNAPLFNNSSVEFILLSLNDKVSGFLPIFSPSALSLIVKVLRKINAGTKNPNV